MALFCREFDREKYFCRNPTNCYAHRNGKCSLKHPIACNYGTSCILYNTRACKFYHPIEPKVCKLIPYCMDWYSNNCNYLHPDCKNGNLC